MLNGGTWFPLTMKLSYENMGPGERGGGAEAPVQWAHSLHFFRADTFTDPPAAWSVLKNYFKGNVLLPFNIFLITSAKLFSCAANFQILPVWVKGQIR